jgi:hypothetical protein
MPADAVEMRQAVRTAKVVEGRILRAELKMALAMPDDGYFCSLVGSKWKVFGNLAFQGRLLFLIPFREGGLSWIMQNAERAVASSTAKHGTMASTPCDFNIVV